MSHILNLEEKAEGTAYTVLRRTVGKTHTVETGTITTLLKDGDTDVLHEHLNGIKEKYGVREVRVLLPFRYFLTSMIEVPVKRKPDIEAALVFELEESLPMPINEYMIDHTIVERRNGLTRILALSIARKLVEKILERFRNEGLEVTSVRCGFMERLSAAYGVNGKKSFLLIDSDNSRYSVAVIRSGVLVEVNHVSDRDSLDSMITNMRQKHEIKTIVLTGEPADDLREMTGNTGEVRTVPGMSRWRKRPFDLEVYHSAVKEWTIGDRKVLVILVLTLAVLLALSGFFLPVYREYNALNKVNGQIEQIKAKATGLFEKREKLELMREKVRFMEEIKRTRDIPLDVLAELSTLLPDNVWLIGFSIDEKGFIELKGFADDTAKLVEMLERSERFRNVGFSSPILTSGDKVRFSIRMEIER